MITNGSGALGALAFLALAGGVCAGAVAALAARLMKQPRWTRRISAAVAAGVALYAVALVGAGLASRPRVLAPGDEKHFCELDCHIAYGVAGADTAPTLGAGPGAVRAAGRFVVVLVRVRFDSATIGPNRGMAPLTPGPRRVALVDADGREYRPDPAAAAALGPAPGETRPFTRALVPGEWYVERVPFDVPPDARGLRLEIEDAFRFPDALIIGDEQSPFHGRVTFALARQAAGTGTRR